MKNVRRFGSGILSTVGGVVTVAALAWFYADWPVALVVLFITTLGGVVFVIMVADQSWPDAPG